MKSAITFHSKTYEQLFYTARKKKNYYELVYVNTGTALIRLGKWEYVVSAGEFFWLPFDSLTSITIVPNSQIAHIAFSIRTREDLPTQGGFVSQTSLLNALIEKLFTASLNEQQEQRLLAVIQDELLLATFHTNVSKESMQVNNYISVLSDQKTTNESNVISAEMALMLKVREADKMRKSGAKDVMIAKRYFSDDIQAMNSSFSIFL